MDHLQYRCFTFCPVPQRHVVFLLGHSLAATDWRTGNTAQRFCRIKHRGFSSDLVDHPRSLPQAERLNVVGEKNTEPFWWGLFSAGGVVAAFLVPIHIIIFGFAVPLGWISDNGVLY